ncbi:MAG: GNAT family N-acetyltransferase [Kangiellaceae bacterium]|nr:GNAT family N-acetyltransferase [Kangiellaceae bacterium]MCW8997907.1 GNAT family N-acetyltransferase [Kangiellaceae bacterium]
MSSDLINIPPQQNYVFEKVGAGDYELYRAIFTCPRSSRFVGEFSEPQITVNFHRVLNSKKENYFSVRYMNSIDKFGFIGASYAPNAKQAEVGFLFLSKQFAKGAGRETAIILLNHLFSNTELIEIKFKIAKANKAAYIGCISIGVNFEDETADGVLKGTILKENWQFW